MIFTNFAPNEAWDDAWISIKMIFQVGSWQKGRSIAKVKQKIKSFFPGHETFLFLTGRAALYQLIKSLSLPKDSEIITQAFTCEAVVLPITANGCRPIYADINPEDYSMDLPDLKKKITEKTKVIILQHTFGILPSKRKEIYDLAKEKKLFVIEDLAHGFNLEGLKSYSTNSAYLLSFGRSKMWSSVFGGAIVTRNKKASDLLQSIARNMDNPSYYFIYRCLCYKPISMLIKSTYHLVLGRLIHSLSNYLGILMPEITLKEKGGDFDNQMNKSYPNALAELLLKQIKKNQETGYKKERAYDIYKNYIRKNHLHIHLTTSRPLLKFPVLVDNRNQIIYRFAKKNIQIGKWYEQVVAPKELSLDKVFYHKKSCPTAEEICNKIINLPLNVSARNAEKIINYLDDFTK